MKVQGTRSFAVERETVWEVLNDPARMAELMPGVEGFDVLDDRHWKANVKIPLGLGGLRMAIDFERLEQREPEFSRLRAKGTGVGALMSMETQFHLSDEAGGTAMRWEADVNIAGPVGGMGQRVLQPIVNQQVANVLNALDAQVMQAGGEAAGATPESPPQAPPTAADEAVASASDTVGAAADTARESADVLADAARETTAAEGDAAERAAARALEAGWGTRETVDEEPEQGGGASGPAAEGDFYPGATPSSTTADLLADDADTGIGDTGDTVAPSEGTAGTPPPSTDAPAHTDPEFYVGAEPSVHPPEPVASEAESGRPTGPSTAETSPGADPAEHEGSSGAEQGINPWSPENRDPDPEGPTISTEDKS